MVYADILYVVVYLAIGWALIVSPVASAISPVLCGEGSLCGGLVEGGIGIVLAVFSPFFVRLKRLDRSQK
jgi:hypothetical protein